jgi:hypothetical protein
MKPAIQKIGKKPKKAWIVVSTPRFSVLHGFQNSASGVYGLIILKNLSEHILQNAAVFKVLHIHIRIQP